MASTVITLNAFARASYVHLAEPYAHQQGDDAKYRLQAMFSKTNVANVPDVGEIESHPYELLDALNEVCMKEFNFPINDVIDVAALKDEVGVGFPPNFKDGDKVKKKDENGRPIPGQFDELTAGYWLLNLSSFDAIDVVDHEEDAIDPKKVYSGCWVRIQVEVSAYYNKSNSPIVNIEPLAVQYVYDDVQLGGGRPPRPDATKAFGKVGNGTAQTRDAKRMGAPQRPGTPPQRPGTPPQRPGAPAKPAKELVSISDYTIEQLRDEYQMSDDDMVEQGFAEWKQVAAKPVTPPQHPKPTPPPAKPVPPKKPVGPKVVMNADSEYSYEDLLGNGWTDEDIVNNGYGTFDYTDPDA